MPSPIDHVGTTVVEAFTGPPLILYGVAIASTGALSFSGGDHQARVFIQTHAGSQGFGTAMIVTGYALPALGGPGVYALGALIGDRTLAGAGAAATQALAVTVASTSLLKWVTGRPYPMHGNDADDPARLSHADYAREYHPFHLVRAIGAWPSGHTSASVSVAAALTGYYPESIWIPLVAYPAAFTVAAGMLVGDRHWASDVLAGGLIAQGIGYTIGRSMRIAVREGESSVARRGSWSFVPMAGASYGIGVAGNF